MHQRRAHNEPEVEFRTPAEYALILLNFMAVIAYMTNYMDEKAGLGIVVFTFTLKHMHRYLVQEVNNEVNPPNHVGRVIDPHRRNNINLQQRQQNHHVNPQGLRH